ncbi:MAG: hypothetical protein RL577_295 [Bacteroidota bacterium]|jgi:regulatory protein
MVGFRQQQPSRLTPSQAKPKIEKYCAYQERSHKQVLEKLRSLGLNEQEAGEMLIELMQEGFVNEARYASSFVRGKFKLKGWGRKKIELSLKREGLSPRQIQTAMSEIQEPQYEQTLVKLAEKKLATLSGTDFERRMKTKRYLLGRGYESEAIDQALEHVDL